MTHPLTPREKVARLIWGRFAPSCDMDEANAMRGEYSEIADAILAALASGSGDHSGGVTDMIDHAELARLAEDVEQNATPLAVSLYRHATAPHHVLALLAEIAALRAEHVHLVEQKEGAEDALFNALSRSTEAERKLAEAVGLVERSVDLMTDEYADTKAYREEARTFLSKEAEQ